MPSRTSHSNPPGLRTLVVMLANKESDIYKNSYEVFDDLFSKVKPETVIAAQLKPHSGPPSKGDIPEGLARLGEDHGVKDLSVCYIKQNSVDDDSSNHWPDYIPEVLRSLGKSLKETSKENLHLHVSAAGFTVSSALYNISQILGCKAWITIRSSDSNRCYSEEIHGTPKLTPFQESTLEGCAECSIESGEPQSFTPEEMQSQDGIAADKGASKSLAGLIQDGYLEKKEEKSGHGRVQYIPTRKGLLEGIFQSARSVKSRRLPIDPQTGIIITARAAQTKEEFRKFLQDHGFHSQFHKVGLVVYDYGEEYDLEEKKDEFSEVIHDLKGEHPVNGAKCCNRIIPVSQGQLSQCSFGLLSQLHSIVGSNDGMMVDWSVIATGIPAVLRTSFVRYCQESGISVIDSFRGLRSGGSGKGGSSFTVSGQNFMKHRVESPSIGDIEKIGKLWNWEHQYVKEPLATLHITGKEIPYKELLEVNRELFQSEDQWQRMKYKVSDSDAKAKSHKKLVSLGAITDRKDLFELTEVGRTAARMIWIREEEW